MFASGLTLRLYCADRSTTRLRAVLRSNAASGPADALGAQRDRLHDVEHRHELEVLVDHPDAGVDRLARVSEGAGRPVDDDLARVRLVQAGQDVHQGGLAGPVLTEEAQHLAAVDRDADVVVGEDAREALGDVLELEAHRPSLRRSIQARPPRRTGGGRAGADLDRGRAT